MEDNVSYDGYLFWRDFLVRDEQGLCMLGLAFLSFSIHAEWERANLGEKKEELV